MLKLYKSKRNFKETPEPKARISRSKGKLIFVIQKHAASHLHYDFRLEAGGVLLSWAVPKGPSIDPTVKRLAIMVEDHPFDYKDFEGVIPKGHYGAGQVIVWDKGTYVPADPKDAQLGQKEAEKLVASGVKKGKLTIFLEGKKLKGEWTLVRTKQNDKQWLLIKHADKYAGKKDVTELEKSVISKKTIDSLKAKATKGTKK